MARDFNGSSDRITHTLSATQNNLTSWSAGAFFYFDNVSQYRRLMQKGDAWPNLDWDWEFDDGWGLVLSIKNWSTTNGAWSITKPSTGSWVHLLHTFNSSSATNDPVIYKDGVSQTITERVTPVGTFSNARSAFYLGSDAASGQYLDGRMGEFFLYNRVLSSAEAAAIGKGLSPRFFPRGLVKYENLFGNASPEPDIVGGTNGTLTGTSKTAHPRVIYPTPEQLAYIASAPAGVSPSSLLTLLGIG